MDVINTHKIDHICEILWIFFECKHNWIVWKAEAIIVKCSWASTGIAAVILNLISLCMCECVWMYICVCVCVSKTMTSSLCGGDGHVHVVNYYYIERGIKYGMNIYCIFHPLKLPHCIWWTKNPVLMPYPTDLNHLILKSKISLS